MILNSEYTPVATQASIGLAQHNAYRIHVGVRFYNQVGDSFQEVEPTAGTVDIKVSKPTIRDEKLIGNLAAIDKTADLTFEGQVTRVTGMKNVNITGATHYKLVVCTE